MLTYGVLSRIWQFFDRIHIPGLESYIKQAKADPWHLYAIKKWHARPHVRMACAWLYEILPESAKIFETGCGSAINLLWFGKHGFISLHGFTLLKFRRAAGSVPRTVWLIQKIS